SACELPLLQSVAFGRFTIRKYPRFAGQNRQDFVINVRILLVLPVAYRNLSRSSAPADGRAGRDCSLAALRHRSCRDTPDTRRMRQLSEESFTRKALLMRARVGAAAPFSWVYVRV